MKGPAQLPARLLHSSRHGSSTLAGVHKAAGNHFTSHRSSRNTSLAPAQDKQQVQQRRVSCWPHVAARLLHALECTGQQATTSQLTGQPGTHHWQQHRTTNRRDNSQQARQHNMTLTTDETPTHRAARNTPWATAADNQQVQQRRGSCRPRVAARLLHPQECTGQQATASQLAGQPGTHHWQQHTTNNRPNSSQQANADH